TRTPRISDSSVQSRVRSSAGANRSTRSFPPMSDTELDRAVLDTKAREELPQIAGAMGVNAATRMKKADLIDAILGAVDGGDASDGGNRPKRVRSRPASEADDPMAELAAEEEAIAAAGASEDASDPPRPVSRTASSSAG